MDTKALRQKILDLAIHGKLVSQDPNDEPASVLLERIRAEKERLIKEGKIKKGKKSAKTSDKPHYPYELPKGWVWTTLGDLFSLQAGKNIAAKEIYPEFSEIYKYPCFGGNGIRGFVSNFNRNGDFPIIGRQGALCGNVNLAIGDFYATEHAVVVERFSDTDLMWTYYVLIALNLNQYATATAQPGLAVNVINDVIVPVPPFQEQCRISKAVTRLFSLINEIEHGKQKLQGTIKQTKSKVLDLAVHGKLVPQDVNDEPANELLKRINPKAEIITDNGHYQKLPEGWTICKLKDICSKLVDGDHNPPKGTKETTEYLMLSAQNIVNDNIVYTNGVRYLNHDTFETSDKRTKVMQGDLLITIVGTLGRSCVFSDNKKITLQRSVACLTPLIYNHFLKYYMDSSSIQKYMTTNAKGTAQKGFYLNQLEQLPIMIPPLTEQQRIVARIEKIFARLDVIESAL